MQIKKEFVLREIAGEYIIIPTGSTALEFNGLITVNEVGVLLWKMLQDEVSMEQLVQGVLAEYDVEEFTHILNYKIISLLTFIIDHITC